jgi:hypothetical protein
MTAHDVLRVYGLLGFARDEQRARVGVLDRMGAFTYSERAVLMAAGFLSS